MDLSLRNRLALVTGSTAGIGYAVASELAAFGASVIVNGRTPARVDAALVAAHPRADIPGESGLDIPVEMVRYGMTKTAQLAVARGIAETVAGTGITVNSVLPGPTSSEGVEYFVKQMADRSGVDAATIEREFFRTARPTSLLRRFTTVGEVANMIAYLCTPAASATNGSSVRVDGGVVKTIA